MESIFVTGGTGFIGSHTCLVLLEKGYNVLVLDSNINSSKKAITRVEELFKKQVIDPKNSISFFKGDIRNIKLIEEIFSNYEKNNQPIIGVIHFAGLKSVVESINNPLSYWENNVLGTINLLKVMKKFNCNNLIFSSSATIYGFCKKSFINEENPISPINPYGNTKATIEKLFDDIFEGYSNKLSICSLRYFNPIGAHPSGLIGENPSSVPNNIFPIICQVAFKKLRNLSIYGNDWNTKDGTCIRDYIHVVDLAEGHVLALEKLIYKKPQKLFINLGTGEGTSVLELVKVFQEVNKVKIPYTFKDRRKGDAERVVADNKMAINLLKWKPRKTLNDMCLDGWNWQIKNPDGF